VDQFYHYYRNISRKTIEIVFFTSHRRKRENYDVFFLRNATNVFVYCEYYNGKNVKRYRSMLGKVKWLSLYLPRSRNNTIARAFLSFVGLLELQVTGTRTVHGVNFETLAVGITASSFRLTRKSRSTSSIYSKNECALNAPHILFYIFDIVAWW